MGRTQTQNPNRKVAKKFTNSKHIEAYTQKDRKRHFGTNGNGFEFQFGHSQK